MVASRHASYSFHKCSPRPQLLSKHTPAFSRDLIEPAAPLLWFLNPSALDPPPLLETVEQGIKRIDVERQLTARAGVDEFAQLIAMAGPGVKQRKDKKLGRSPLQLAIKRPGVDICHEQIVRRQTSKVKPLTYGSYDFALETMRQASEQELTELIRRQLALPMNKRTNFLRIRLPNGGSCL
jgi:hypothetical protein